MFSLNANSVMICYENRLSELASSLIVSMRASEPSVMKNELDLVRAIRETHSGPPDFSRRLVPHRSEGNKDMSVSERRTARRFILDVPLQLQRIKAPSLAARAVKAVNISSRGVYFTTDLPLC